MPYSPPPGSAVTLAFPSIALYTPPPGSAVALEFTPPAENTVLSATVGDNSTFGLPALAWTQFVSLDTNHDGIQSAEEFSTSIGVDYPRVRPSGVPSEEAFGTLFIYLQQQFVSTESLPEWLLQAGHRVRDAQLTYLDNLPNGGALTLAFTTPYYPPPGAYTVLEFNQGATPTIRPQGIVSQEAFGTPELVATPVARAIGFDSSEFGTAEVYNLTQVVYASGLASTNAFGTATVFDPLQYITHTGSDYSAFGTTEVYNLTQISYPTGIPSALAFGTATVENKNRELTLTGINALAFGTAHVFDPLQYLRPLGFNYQSWGTSSIINVNRYLSPTGSRFDALGTAHVENANRNVYPQRIDPKGFGTATIYNLTQYKAMNGFQDDAFGTPYIIGPRYLRPSGWKSEKFGPYSKASPYIQYYYIQSIDPFYYSVPYPTVTLKHRAIHVDDGISPPEMFGALVYIAPTDVIDCTDNSIYESVVSEDTEVTYNTDRGINLNRRGILGTAFGTTSVSPFTFRPLGKDWAVYGKPRVENYTRYVSPASIGVAVRFGVSWASHYIRYVYPTGFDKSSVFNAYGPIDLDNGRAAGVYPGPVYIYPTGFEGSGVTYDPCGFPRTPPIPRPSVHP